MKKLIIIAIVSILISCNQSELTNESPKFHKNVKESVVYMTSNNKSENEINDFCIYYQNKLKEKEPNVFAWKFFKSESNKITLIERYKNEDAILNHIKNISKGGLMEQDFGKFVDHFIIDSIEYYGNLSTDFKETISAFGLTVNYNPNIAGFSRN
jgi:hypothetical protein